MEDNQLYALFWKCAACVVATAVVTIGSCTAHQNYLQKEVLEKTGNPTALNCSFSGKEASNTPFCMEAAKALNK